MALNYHTILGEFVNFIFKCATNCIFTFVATFVDVECVFSQGRIVLSHLQSRLSIQSTWALMCVGVRSTLGYVKDSDIKDAIMQPEIPVHEREGPLVEGWDSIF